jgi:osmotically-inducible protein OsmY
VTVTDGVVTIQGALETTDMGRSLMERIRHVTGVVAVRDELSWPPPERSIAGIYI